LYLLLGEKNEWHAKVKEAIAKSLWRMEYMTYKEHMDQEYNRGLEDGEKKGEIKGEIKGRVLARYEDGMPIAEIANKSGISEDEVKTILKDEGLI
jgi:DNA invertase Pin-like site-specific DNA recombinase